MSQVFYPFGHFPISALVHGESDDLHPLALSLDDAMEWYWRVQTFEVKLDLSCVATLYDKNGNPTSTTPVTASLTETSSLYTGYLDTAVTDESQLVVPSYAYLSGGTCTSSLGNSGGSVTMNLFHDTGGIQGGVNDGSEALRYDGTSYYPYLSLGGQIGVAQDDNAGQDFSVSLSFTSSKARAVGSASLTNSTSVSLGNSPFTLYYGGFDGFYSNPKPLTGASLTATITPTAQWSYVDS